MRNSPEAKLKMHNKGVGSIRYNNGKQNISLHIGEEIPEGFVKGMFLSEEEHKARSERYKKINWEKYHGESSATTDKQTD